MSDQTSATKSVAERRAAIQAGLRAQTAIKTAPAPSKADRASREHAAPEVAKPAAPTSTKTGPAKQE